MVAVLLWRLVGWWIIGSFPQTEAIRRALGERRVRLQARAGKPGGRNSLREYLEQNVWPMVPAGELGRVMTREEEDHILATARKATEVLDSSAIVAIHLREPAYDRLIDRIDAAEVVVVGVPTVLETAMVLTARPQVPSCGSDEAVIAPT